MSEPSPLHLPHVPPREAASAPAPALVSDEDPSDATDGGRSEWDEDEWIEGECAEDKWIEGECAEDERIEGERAEDERTEGARAEDEEIEPDLQRLADDIPPSLIELERIPRRLWEQTLAPLQRQQRYRAAERVADEGLREIAGRLAFDLDMAECERQNTHARARFKARRSGYPLPVPEATHAAARSSVQVNLRLRRDDHERLAQAAAAVGLKPTTLARALVLNGVAMTLREHVPAKVDCEPAR